METKKLELKTGEQYLTVFILRDKEGVACFPKVSKNGIKYFKGDGVTVFVNKKKPSKDQVQEPEEIRFN